MDIDKDDKPRAEPGMFHQLQEISVRQQEERRCPRGCFLEIADLYSQMWIL